MNEVPHSWRVALLPILGFSELYKQYRFDEPWDSENNRKLIEKMPEIYRKKGASSSQGQTHFQLVVGNEAAFSENSITRFADVTDGTSNTIAIVLASQSVPWTKPEDFSFPEKGIKELDPSHLVGLLDGVTSGYPLRCPTRRLARWLPGLEVKSPRWILRPLSSLDNCQRSVLL